MFAKFKNETKQKQAKLFSLTHALDLSRTHARISVTNPPSEAPKSFDRSTGALQHEPFLTPPLTVRKVEVGLDVKIR
jgi:hypothetical protein